MESLATDHSSTLIYFIISGPHKAWNIIGVFSFSLMKMPMNWIRLITALRSFFGLLGWIDNWTCLQSPNLRLQFMYFVPPLCWLFLSDFQHARPYGSYSINLAHSLWVIIIKLTSYLVGPLKSFSFFLGIICRTQRVAYIWVNSFNMILGRKKTINKQVYLEENWKTKGKR